MGRHEQLNYTQLLNMYFKNQKYVDHQISNLLTNGVSIVLMINVI